MRLALLTNYVLPYRVSTFVELRRCVASLDIVLSSPVFSPGLVESGISIHCLPSFKVPQTRRHENGYRERVDVHLPHGVIGVLRRLRPDCVVASEFGLRTILAAAYCTLSRTPLVVHADLSEEYESGRGRIRRIVRKALLKVARRVLANGRSAARYIESLGYDRRRISFLPYATDLDHFGAAPRPERADDILRLVYVGQLIERKGLESFVGILSQELTRRPELAVELILAGDGDRRDVLAALPHPPNLQVRLQGQVDYALLDRLYAGCDVFVMPTLGDTWGLVVNESMASGLPVLGSLQSQAVVEMVDDGVHGWVFDALSEPSLRTAINRVFDTPRQQRRLMGERAQARARFFSPSRSAGQIIAACRAAIDEARVQPGLSDR